LYSLSQTSYNSPSGVTELKGVVEVERRVEVEREKVKRAKRRTG
jgi:hypothetical protein